MIGSVISTIVSCCVRLCCVSFGSVRMVTGEFLFVEFDVCALRQPIDRYFLISRTTSYYLYVVVVVYFLSLFPFMAEMVYFAMKAFFFE